MTDRATMEFIEHYGVKGMKWGVRRKAPPVNVLGPSKDAKTRAKIQKKAKESGLDALSDAELSKAINRMNLEVSYSRLSEQTRKKSPIEKAVNFLINDVAETEVKRVTKASSALAVEKALEKHGQEDLAKRIKPKKK